MEPVSQDPQQTPSNSTPYEVPSQQPTPEEVAAANDSLSTATKAVIAAALVYMILNGEDSSASIRLSRSSARAAKRVVSLLKKLYKFDSIAAYGSHYEVQLAKSIEDVAVRWSRDHAKTMRDAGSKAKTDKKWTEAASHTMSTQVMSEALTNMSARMSVAAARGDVLPTPLVTNVRKMWLSRSDLKVRHSHRRLHGEVRNLQSNFKTWKTGEVLSFPGDLRAPLSETINCRCFLWMVLTDEVPKVEPLPITAALSQDLAESLWTRTLCLEERELLAESLLRTNRTVE